MRLVTREGSYALVFPPEVGVELTGDRLTIITQTGRRVSAHEEVEVGGGEMAQSDSRLRGDVSLSCNAQPRWQVSEFVEPKKPPAPTPTIPAPVGNDQIRVVAAQACEVGCNYVIEYSADAQWQRASAPPVVGSAVQVRSRGDYAYVLVGHDPAHGAKAITTYILVSADRGQSWIARADPCATDPAVPSDAREAALGFDGTLVLLCTGIGKGL